MDLNEKNGNARIIIAGAILAVLYLLAGSLPIKHLWGFNFLSYLPWFSLPVFGLLFFLALLPPSADRIYSIVHNIFRKFNGLLLTWRIIIIVALSISVFYLFRVHVHSLGDGYQRIYQIEQGYLYYHTEVLDFFLHGVLYAALKLVGIFSGETTYIIFSIAAGTIFVLAVYLFRFTNDDEFDNGPIIKVLIVTFGGLQLFFGYAESYSLFYVFSLLYILYAVKFMLSRRGLLTASIMLALACASHITSLVLVPSFVYLIYHNQKNVKPKTFGSKYPPIIISFTVVAAVLVQEILLRVNIGEYITSVSGGYLHLLPFSDYTILSPMHLFDVLNEILVVAPVALILFIAGISSTNTGARKKLNIFLLIAGLSAGLMLMIIDPKLGFPRDWDLFSIPAAILGLAVSIYFINKINFSRKAPYVKLITGFFPVILLSGWVLMNSSLKGQLTRAEDLLTLKFPRFSGHGERILLL
ncbi:MAG: hypothetical protein CVT49_14940 [candidate division Zixibacteria bacterium HGW-Zixibacteria-1]|nr:MAG: hypothetical protein CVT49_14940 [candidate division Zixibacteria bacterium HGW-Zixibacteria-1]